MAPTRPATTPDDRLEALRGADLTMLASDCGPAPMHIAAILLLDGADDGTTRVVDALVERARHVPRLVQVLVGPRRSPAWGHDDAADPARHVTAGVLPGGGERAVLDEAAVLVCSPLDRGRPLWAARWLTGWDATSARRGALVVVLHHVLVDGVGGLGVLAALADAEHSGDQAPSLPAEVTAGAPGALAWLHGLLELGLGGGPPVLAARTSLNRATGATRHLHVARVPLATFRAAAHRHGGSVNDGMVAAVVGALTGLLEARGEHPRRLVVSVPVTGRPTGDRRAGNDNGVIPVAVPVRLDRDARVRHVAAATARRKARPRGRSALLLGVAFRRLAALGRFRWFVEHQRLVHTFETNVRGPAGRLRIAGHEVSSLLPVAVNPGNIGASFAVLSYAGELAVTVVTDPDVVPDADALVALLQAELDGLVGAPGHRSS